jgi:hypothetical protein
MASLPLALLNRRCASSIFKHRGMAVSVRLISTTIAGFISNNRDGFIPLTPSSKNINQGLGLSFMGTAFDLNRQYLDGKHLEDTWSFSTAMGLLGIERI